MVRNIFAVAFALTIFIAPTQGNAQDVNGDGHITFLVPVNAQQPAPAARGSVWQTQVWLHNGLDEPVRLADCGGLLPCFVAVYPAGETTQVVSDLPNYGAGLFAIDLTRASQITVSARLFELTKRAQSAGVHIPIVRERDFFSGPVRFIALDGSANNRVAVRIYDPFRLGDASVRVDIVSATGAAAATANLPLQYTQSQFEPGFAAIYDVTAAFPQVTGAGRFDLVVTPLRPSNMRFWAVVSVTDQETQQVLLVTPD